MKVLLIPDVHGRDFWELAKDKIEEVDKVVFLGDYFDPYPYEFNNGEIIKIAKDYLHQITMSNVKEILEFKKQFPEKITLLLGNHEIPYRNNDYAASRFDWSHCEEINDFLANNSEYFQVAKVIDDYLFTHAGVSRDWLDFCNFNDVDIEKFLNEDVELRQLMSCGSYRGGYSKYSGPMWQDCHELDFLDPYDDYIQIFGHTQLGETGSFIHKDNWYCIDSRACFLLDTKTKELKLLNK